TDKPQALKLDVPKTVVARAQVHAKDEKLAPPANPIKDIKAATKVDPKAADHKLDPHPVFNPKLDPKIDPKGKLDPKIDPKGKLDPKIDPKGKFDPKVDPKGKFDPKKDPKDKDPKDPKGDPKKDK